jgi:hypothetical protein
MESNYDDRAEDNDDNKSLLGGSPTEFKKKIKTVTKKQIYKTSQAKHPLAFRK